MFNLIPPVKFNSHLKNDCDSCITHCEWLALYQKHLDHTQIITAKDTEREFIRRRKRAVKFYKFIAKLITLPLIGKPFQKLRRGIRDKILEYLENRERASR